MPVNWIDHIVIPVASLEDAAAPYQRLGLHLTDVARHERVGTENRAMFVGEGANDFYLEFLAIPDRDAAETNAPERTAIYLEALESGRGAARLMLGTEDISSIVDLLAGRGVNAQAEAIAREGGAKIGDVVALEGLPALATHAGAIQYTEPRASQHERRAAAGYFNHDFPLKRLDHLAVMAPDIEGATAAWSEALGVPVHGEVRGRGILIRQMKIGDAIVELLGPESPDSPLASRPPGLSSMAAWEVADLDAAVALARERGFTPSDPAEGILPGTRVATIPGTELAGVGMQLLQYV
jgi:catechol 2,3-dioxygenase-like lactoylglutathione lyase family enzyme